MSTVARMTDKDFPIAPAGTQVARCYQVIDLGHQKVVWQDEDKWVPKILLTWELLGSDKMTDGRPFAISNRYTLSLSKKSILRPMLEAWRGKPFADEEAREFEVKKVLGAYCMLNVVHKDEGDRTYANVAAVMALPKDMPKPTAVNAPVYFNLDTDEVSKLPEWIQKVINKSREKSVGVAGMTDDKPWETAKQFPPENFDEIPF